MVCEVTPVAAVLEPDQPLRAASWRAHANDRPAFMELHRLHTKWQFDRCSGDPPRCRGMISSTSPRIGSGIHPVQSGLVQRGPCWLVKFSDLSTSWSQMPQWSDSARTRAMMARRRCPFALAAGDAKSQRSSASHSRQYGTP